MCEVSKMKLKSYYEKMLNRKKINDIEIMLSKIYDIALTIDNEMNIIKDYCDEISDKLSGLELD